MPTNPDNNTQSDSQRELAVYTQKHAQYFIDYMLKVLGRDLYSMLDYSVKSLAVVDDVLDVLYREAADTTSKNHTVVLEIKDAVAMDAGCYILEVAKRNFGGRYAWITEWNEPTIVTGEPEYSVSLGVCSKAKGR
ncbi:hypothetical protein HG437_004690, partial [Candidatus Saccharibacteria bacterium]|nr:hypothetical protein [Candidatus Saccharibacteria bacterium]